MTLIHSDKLRIEPVFTHRKGSEFGSLPARTRQTFVCAQSGCGREFFRFPGMRVMGSGIAICAEHKKRGGPE
jgi:hypothetical protein